MQQWRPYWIITNITGPVNVQLQNLQDERKIVNVHVNRIKIQTLNKGERAQFRNQIEKVQGQITHIDGQSNSSAWKLQSTAREEYLKRLRPRK